MFAGVCRLRRLSLLFAAATVCSACALTRTPSAAPAAPVHEFATTTTLHGRRLDLHVAVPRILARDGLFVIYASGDGGWFGTAIDQWREIARAGYASVGFSSRAFLRIERPAEASLNSARLAAEYEQIVEDAQRALGWGESPRVILAGWSRGAAFAVLTGTEPPLRGTLAGVVAIGLAEGEDLKIDGNGDDTDDGAASTTGRRWPFDTYARLMQLRAPCAVIQATHDNYFAAADARRRFGPDTATRRFYQVDAKNHRFAGGTAAFNSALTDALNWISSAGPAVDTHALQSASTPVGRGLE
jgi:dienelactone hydrolase